MSGTGELGHSGSFGRGRGGGFSTTTPVGLSGGGERGRGGSFGSGRGGGPDNSGNTLAPTPTMGGMAMAGGGERGRGGSFGSGRGGGPDNSGNTHAPTPTMGGLSGGGERGRGGSFGRGRGGGPAPDDSVNTIAPTPTMGGMVGGGERGRGGSFGRGRGGGFSAGPGLNAEGGDQLPEQSDSKEMFGSSRGRGGRGSATFSGMRGGGAGQASTVEFNAPVDVPSYTTEARGRGRGGFMGQSGGSRGNATFSGMRGGGTGQASSAEFNAPADVPSYTTEAHGRGRGGFMGQSGGGGGRGGAYRAGTGANNEPVGVGQNVSNESQQGQGAMDKEFRQLQGESAEPRPVSRYVPPKRTMDEIFKEDLDHQQLYMDISEADDQVGVSAANPLPVMESWNDIQLDPKLRENIVDHSHYVRPRKIQANIIPYVLAGSDVKCLSETGSGKTAAFMIPIIQKILSLGEDARMAPARPFAIIIEPTRELCVQVYEQGMKLADGTFVEVAKAYGQYNRLANSFEVKRGCHILCATPGRLKDFIFNRELDLSKLIFFVLDEADRMLESGFLDDIRNIIEQPGFPPKEKRQTLLYSATFPPEVQQMADEVVRPDFVMASNNKPISPNMRVEQEFLAVEQPNKTDCLKEMLDAEMKKATEKDPANPKIRRTLVFVQTRRDANMLALYLVENGVQAQSISGDRTQEEREKALQAFRGKEYTVLVATDVMARGIDVKDLDHVVNYDLPPDLPTYVHRIGRTGRLKAGFATSFVDIGKDGRIVEELKDMLKKLGKPIPPFMDPDGAAAAGDYQPQGQGGGGYGNVTAANTTTNMDVGQSSTVDNNAVPGVVLPQPYPQPQHQFYTPYRADPQEEVGGGEDWGAYEQQPQQLPAERNWNEAINENEGW